MVVFWLPVLLWALSVDASAPAASTPPRGWNSYDSYSWVISEQQFLHNARLVSQKLLPFGYQYVVVDFLWYRKLEPGASVLAAGFDNIDEWGRPIPDPVRWPSSSGGQGFKPIADQVHAMGLKFGIHVMRGISTQAVKENALVFGNLNQTWRAKDIAIPNQACSWMPKCFMRVNESTQGGKAFIQSLYNQYASWEVDFVKHDCVFGTDLSLEEVTTVSQAIVSTGRPMLYSISPGVQANLNMATLVNSFVNMYRITGDDWDTWHDLKSHFDIARDFAAAGLIGATGLLGFSWPDLDMLPIGYLTDAGAVHGPSRMSRLSSEEQKTQMTLWAMAKSPLMFGGDMLNLDNATFNVLTNPVALEINANSFGNTEVQMSGVIWHYVPSISLLDCEGAKSTSWRLRYEAAFSLYPHLCWSHGHGECGCLLWEPSSATTTAQLQKTSTTQQCTADASTDNTGWASLHKNRRTCLDARATAHNSFSPCSQLSTQIWHVNPGGKLVSNVTNLCAVVDGLKLVDEPGQSMGIRVWMARDAQGMYYVAVFNLEEEQLEVSVSLASLVDERENVRQVEGRGFNSPKAQCRGKEAWSNQNVTTLQGNLHVGLAPHGCALFSLSCS